MKIDFFEEFPTETNLAKVKLIDFESVIYLAANSFKEFESIKNRIEKINPKIEAAYWPVLRQSYWISPFSYTYELKNLYSDLFNNRQDKPLKVMLDLELPILNKRLLILNLFPFIFRNKRIIQRFFIEAKEHNLEILTAEYPVYRKLFQKLAQFIGVSYHLGKYPHNRIYMFYSSMIKKEYFRKRIEKYIPKKAKRLGSCFQIGLGVIAPGQICKESILSPKDLNKDLKFVRKQGIKRAVIFRLGGLNQEYLEIIEQFI
jgi:hypothetical protein